MPFILERGACPPFLVHSLEEDISICFTTHECQQQIIILLFIDITRSSKDMFDKLSLPTTKITVVIIHAQFYNAGDSTMAYFT